MRAIRKSVITRIHGLIRNMERMGLTEYMAYLSNWKRMLWLNFLSGVARGLGIAVGFSILGAILIVLVQRLTLENLPVIGEFLAEVIRMVQRKL